jgi:hypothetical protein
MAATPRPEGQSAAPQETTTKGKWLGDAGIADCKASAAKSCIPKPEKMQQVSTLT